MNSEPEKVLLLGVFETENAAKGDELLFDRSMTELDALVSACELEPVGMLTQQLPLVSRAAYLGTGKLSDARERIAELGASLCVVNDTLTPTQLRNLQKELGVPVRDRTALILDIFRKRARSREARLQVELAELQYTKPRLRDLWETQNRQGGASGALSSKGEGETQIELDRREIDHRLAELRKDLELVERERQTQRKRRQRSRLPLVSLIGYTNAGKSAVMNAMLGAPETEEGARTEAGPKTVLEKNMLFATLDTSVRRIPSENSRDFMLSDTVGFVSKLPTALVEAFKSTLEEVTEADLLLHIVDCSDRDYRSHMEVTENMIRELGAGHIPEIIVYNKADACYPPVPYPRKGPKVRDASGQFRQSVWTCAKDPESVKLLKEMILEELWGASEEAEFLIPYDRGGLVSALRENAEILETEYLENGTRLRVRCRGQEKEKYREYLRMGS